SRKIPFSRELYIEREDFMENPPRKFFRLAPGKEVRLKHAYYITCTDVIKDDEGNITELRCTYDPETRGGWSKDARKVKGTSHWVSAKHAINAEIRQYKHLFNAEFPGEKTGDFFDDVNPDSLKILKNCKIEPSLVDAKVGERFQFLRMGYFCVDPDSTPEAPVFNRTASLRDTWAKVKRNM
ncbi:MAG: glutamine--tRNA ligase, partial [Candidatus Cloacimonetes bacterium]|nr:glutamine--tRNA ligase [Candidatus Cloacimonadota bacterium]